MKKLINVTFALIQIIILYLLLFVAGNSDYYTKREQLFSNFVYVVAGAVIVFIGVFVLSHFLPGLEDRLGKIGEVAVIIPLGVFFVLAVSICISGFFYSDWDPMSILYAVSDLLAGHPEEVGSAYFSNHPNNLLLVWIYYIVMKLASASGAGSVLSLVVVQCFLATVTGYIFYKILRDMFPSNLTVSFAGVIAFGVWLVLSPWFIITYSDEAGFIIPVLMLRLYQMITLGKIRAVTGWTILPAVAAFGYFIKPQIVIAFIAMLLLYVAGNLRTNKKELAICICRSIVAILAAVILVKGVIIPSMRIDLDNNKSFGMAHYFMMGLNLETDGVYSDEDTLFTDDFDTPEEKRAADMQVAVDRIRNYGLGGLLNHSARKTMVNFGDGLFSWGVDGNFFDGRSSDSLGDVPANQATALIWSFILPVGSNHGKYSSCQQMIWLTVLLAGLLCAVFAGRDRRKKAGLSSEPGSENKGVDKETAFLSDADPRGMPEASADSIAKKANDIICVVLLSLIGLFVFELLFEAKARYLFIYTPYYLLAAVCGVYFTAEHIGPDGIKRWFVWLIAPRYKITGDDRPTEVSGTESIEIEGLETGIDKVDISGIDLSQAEACETEVSKADISETGQKNRPSVS